MKKLSAVYNENAELLQISAFYGYPYAVLVSQEGHSAPPDAFRDKETADIYLSALNRRGINGAVCKTTLATENRPGGYTLYIRPKVRGFASCNCD